MMQFRTGHSTVFAHCVVPQCLYHAIQGENFCKKGRHFKPTKYAKLGYYNNEEEPVDNQEIVTVAEWGYKEAFSDPVMIHGIDPAYPPRARVRWWKRLLWWKR